ncbi:MAG: DUF2934 domain-containing protein [Alphaproteobacteria bacterium]|nr:DUF2934 domain-containing protein [Alphaproteobacteria bacterium]
MMMNMNIDEDKVRMLAYSMWEADGCPMGRAEEHWMKAMEAMMAKAAAKKPAAKKPAAKPAAKKPAAKKKK